MSFKLVGIVSLFLTTFYVGSVYGKRDQQPEANFSDTTSVIASERREAGYSLINPLLECEYLTSQGNTKLKDLKDAVENVVENKQDQEISVYYRDLLNGPWYGYNEQAAFAPQSLLKVPVVFAYLKIADEDPAILDKKILYQQVLETNLAPEDSLVLGQEYSIDFLIHRTLKLSDNVAFDLLVANLPPKYLMKVHEDLNITYPSQETPTDFISVQTYSSVFRVLYNSSYLSRKNSEYMLEILRDSEFKEGLAAGVPAEVTVSHKFGIRNASAQDSATQLHDCGIIYHPTNPYLICIMTKGNDQQAQTATLREISSEVYQVINSPK